MSGTGEDRGTSSSIVFIGGVAVYRFGVDAPEASEGVPYDLMPADLRPWRARLVGEDGLPPGPLPFELASETALLFPLVKLRLPRKMSSCPRWSSSSVSPSSVRVSAVVRSSGLVCRREKLSLVGVVTVSVEFELVGRVFG